MSFISQFSRSFFSNIFGKKNSDNTSTSSKELNSNEDTISTNSISSFSMLKRSSNDDQQYYCNPVTTISKRENIFFGKDIESNDTNEIIDYNLKKLRENKHQNIITTTIRESEEIGKDKKLLNSNDNNTIKINESFLGNREIKNTPNFESESNIETENKIETTSNDNDSDNDNDTYTYSDNDSNVDIDSSSNSSFTSDSNSDSDTNSDVSSETDSNNDLDLENTNNYNNNTKKINSHQDQKKQPNNNNNNKSKSRHNSVDDIILEDLDMDKLIYNVPPPFIKVSHLNPMDTIPLKGCRDSMSVPANLTKFSKSDLGQSYISRNILNFSFNNSMSGSSKGIPGIKTIELRKPKTKITNSTISSSNNVHSASSLSMTKNLPLGNSRLSQYTFRRRSSTTPLSHSLSSSFSEKDFSVPTSLLAIQYEQPSFGCLINEESKINEEDSDSDSSYFPYDAEEEEYDIFNNSLK